MTNVPGKKTRAHESQKKVKKKNFPNKVHGMWQERTTTRTQKPARSGGSLMGGQEKEPVKKKVALKGRC